MNPITAPGSNSFTAENKGFEKSHAGIENAGNKKSFWGSCLVSPIKNAARYIVDGIRTVFRKIRSFLITVCSPSGSCFRKGKSDSSGQDSPSSVERDAGQFQHDISSRRVELHEQPALAEPVSQDTDDLSDVKLVSSHQGIEGSITRRPPEEPYGVVNSTRPTPASRTRQSDVSTHSDISFEAAVDPAYLSLQPIPSAPPLDAEVPSAPPLDAEVPSAPPLEAAIPSAPPLDAEVPSAPPLEAAIPSAPPLDAEVPSAPPLEAAIPSAPPLDAAVPSAPPLADLPSGPSEKKLSPHVGPAILVASSPGISGSGSPVPVRKDTDRALQVDAALNEVAPHAQPSSARPVSQETRKANIKQMAIKLLPSRTGGFVTLVYAGMKELMAYQDAESRKGYGVVSPVDETGQLPRSGVAGVIRGLAGDEALASQKQDSVKYGQCCFRTFDDTARPDHGNWRAIYGVRFLPASDPEFDLRLKENILDILSQAARDEVARVFFPLEWDRDGGSGEEVTGRLGKAVNEALYAFQSRHPGKVAPDVFLVANGDISDRNRCGCFEKSWLACEKKREETLQRRARRRARNAKQPNSFGARPRAVADEAATRTATRAATGTVTRTAQSGRDNQQKVLINGQLKVVMRTDGGMFGYGRELSGEGKAFDLVNATDGYMDHSGGMAGQFAQDLGDRFRFDTRQPASRKLNARIPDGQCITTGTYAYAENPQFGLTNCRRIHNVVAPRKADGTTQEYEDAFKEAFVSLLLAARSHGSNIIVSSFIGCCAISGGDGHDMARALHAACHDERIKALPEVPELVLAGWSGDGLGNDWQVYNDFISTFEALNKRNPVNLPSRE